jgi:hypothetical protein
MPDSPRSDYGAFITHRASAGQTGGRWLTEQTWHSSWVEWRAQCSHPPIICVNLALSEYPRGSYTMTRFITLAFLAASAVLLTIGCASDEAAKNKNDDGLQSFGGPSVSTTEEDGLIVERFTLDDDDKPDVIKYFEEYADPDDKSITKRRLRKKEVDVNSDGKIDIIRNYDKLGTLTAEKLDVDLDGTPDTLSYFDNGDLVKKESLSRDGSEVVETRFYSSGKIIRVEKDLNKDKKIDYWEYYEEGTLDRVGRDIDADGRADSWTRR